MKGKASLPQCLEAEKSLIGSLMLNAKIISHAVEEVGEEDIHLQAHRGIWRLLVCMWAENKPIDLVTVSEAADATGIVEQVGGHSYITECFTFVPTATNWKEYAAIVREKAFARRAIDIGNEILEAAYDPASGHGLSEIIQAALVKITGLSESKAETKHIKDVLLRRLEYFENLSRSGTKLEGLPTGIANLDRLMRGLRPGNMITIAAETKGGKSALALNIATNVALCGHAVGVISLEMNEGELADRLISAHASVDLAAITDGGLSKSSADRIRSTIQTLIKTKITIRDESVLTPLQFRAVARKLVAQQKCQLLIVDYLQLMAPGSNDDTRERQVAECSRTIKTTASELGIPIIVLSQLNENGRSRESRAIEQDSNIFAVIEERDGNCFINLKYTRDCPRGRIPVTFHREFTRFDAAA